MKAISVKNIGVKVLITNEKSETQHTKKKGGGEGGEKQCRKWNKNVPPPLSSHLFNVIHNKGGAETNSAFERLHESRVIEAGKIMCGA